jgi:Fur family transcriptional regulator, ferric uptake regulator
VSPRGGAPRIVAVSDSEQPVPWAEQAALALARAGYRRGGARQAMLALLDEQRCALSALEIEQTLRARGQEVSRASVYRVLEELSAIGVVHRLEVGHGGVRYEPARLGPGHHHHLLCEGCGRLEPFTDAGLERAIGRVAGRVPLCVVDHEIVIRGACQACAPA